MKVGGYNLRKSYVSRISSLSITLVSVVGLAYPWPFATIIWVNNNVVFLKSYTEALIDGSGGTDLLFMSFVYEWIEEVYGANWIWASLWLACLGGDLLVPFLVAKYIWLLLFFLFMTDIFTILQKKRWSKNEKNS